MKDTTKLLSITACNCHPEGSDGQDCSLHGICACKQHVSGEKCDHCQEGYVNFPKCDKCNGTYFGYPDCKECSCSKTGSKNISCNEETGVCDCHENFIGDKCDTCAEGFYGYPTCKGIIFNYCNFTLKSLFLECKCYCKGTIDEDKACDDYGQCNCKPGYTGDKCDECKVGHYIQGHALGQECLGILNQSALNWSSVTFFCRMWV